MSNTEFIHWGAFYRREQIEREKAEKKSTAKRGR